MRLECLCCRQICDRRKGCRSLVVHHAVSGFSKSRTEIPALALATASVGAVVAGSDRKPRKNIVFLGGLYSESK